MPRVNLDSEVWTDPQVKRLARLCGWNMPHTVGTLAAVWNVAYSAKDPVISKLDGDTAAEHDGFIELMLREDVALAELEPDGRVYLHGVEKRIAYLLRQAERGAEGGRKRAKGAKREPSGRMVTAEQTPSTDQAKAKHTPSERLANAKHIPSLPLPLPLPPDLPLPLDPALAQIRDMSAAPTPRVSKGKVRASPEELATVRMLLDRLGERSGVNYRGSEKHTALILARLRQGVTAWDMRRVIGYCAEKLGWQGDPKWGEYLRPETLFGPETIERYLDKARAWAPGPPPEEESAAAPVLRLVNPDEAVRNAKSLTGPEWEEPPWMATTSA